MPLGRWGSGTPYHRPRRSVWRRLKSFLLLALALGLAYYFSQGGADWTRGETVHVADPLRARVIDGDTFAYGGEKIRLADIDAPEIDPPHCPGEAVLGLRAKARLAMLLAVGPFDMVPGRRDEDKYGRKLRDVVRNGRSIGDMLVAEGLARRSEGGRKPWCAGPAAPMGR